MLRAIFRMASLVCLAVALVSGVLDVTRSIADQQMVLTPLIADWVRFSPDSLATTREFVVSNLHPWLWTPAMETVLRAPTWSVFAVLAILFGMGARRRRRRWQENFGA